MLSPVIVPIYILPVPQVTMALNHPAVPDVVAMLCPACTKADSEDIQIRLNILLRRSRQSGVARATIPD